MRTNVYLYKDSDAFCSMYYFSYFLQGLEFIQQNTEQVSSIILWQFQTHLVPNDTVTRREGDVMSFCGFFNLSSYQKFAEASWITVTFW